MAHANLPDFVITKKRKRSRLQAVDPCLGYYPTAESSSPINTSPSPPPPLCLGLRPIDIPFVEQIAHTSSPSFTCGAPEQSDLMDHGYRPAMYRMQAATEDVTLAKAPDIDDEREVEATLTVERFLRSAATTKVTKRYSNWHSRQGANKERGPPSRKRQKRQIEWTSDDEEDVPEEPARKRQRRRKKTRPRPLSARILAAAVVTGVDVVGGLLFPDPPKAHTSTRRRLPLSLGDRAPSPVSLAKSRRRRFVDPRKVDRPDSQFVPAIADAAVEQVQAQRPITAWKPERPAVVSPSLGQDHSELQEYFATRPLTLVSSTHPRSALRAKCTTIISRSCPIPKKRKNETWRSERGGPPKSSSLIPNLPMVPSSPASSALRLHGSSLSSHNITRDDSYDLSVIRDHTRITLCADASVPPAPVPIPSPPSPLHSTLDSNLDEVWASRSSQRPKFAHKLDPLIALPPRSVPPKPLKPLGSLLDDLREIARNATQAAAFQARRERPDTARSGSVNVCSASLGYRDPLRERSPTAPSMHAALSARLVASKAQMDIAPTQEGDSFEDGGVRCDASVDPHPDTHRVDVLAILHSNQRRAILLPSSPLPGWNALPSSSATAHVREESDLAKDDDDDY